MRYPPFRSLIALAVLAMTPFATPAVASNWPPGNAVVYQIDAPSFDIAPFVVIARSADSADLLRSRHAAADLGPDRTGTYAMKLDARLIASPLRPEVRTSRSGGFLARH